MKSGRSEVQQYEILVTVNFASMSDRDFFSGILRFSHSRPDWRLRILQTSGTLTASEIRRAERNSTSGIITCGIGNARAQQVLLQSRIPLVLVGHHETLLEQRRHPTACVTVDNVAIGRTGAAFLSGLGNFAAFSYLPSGKADFARMDRSREIGFKRFLKKQRLAYLPASDTDNGLSRWLRDMPKPLALLCATDECAVRALKTCETLGIRVPDKVAVLGIDNDELLCRTTTPELSSIAIDSENEGYVAAEQMEHLLSDKTQARTPIVKIAPVELHVAERSSTKATSPARHLIAQAERFIAENAHKPIKVDDIVCHLQVSRRLIELRFRQFKGIGIHDAIVQARLEMFAKKLIESGAPIKAISAACGFRNASYLKTVFKSHFGESPCDYRRHSRSQVLTAQK